MGLFNMNFFNGGLFKQAKYMVSTPQQAQKVVLIDELGTLSMESLSIYTAYMDAPAKRRSWMTLHKLKLQMKDKHGVIIDDPILFISPRSYIPLDPFNRIEKDDIEKFTSLHDIARNCHAEALAEVGSKNTDSPRTRMLHTVITGGLLLLALIVVLSIFKGG